MLFTFSGYILPNGKYVGKNIFQELVNLNSVDFRMAHKLTQRHISVEGTGRMNVRLAVQLFSMTVAKALIHCEENNYIKISNLKDHKFDNGIPSYGLDEINQNKLIDKMNEFIINMRVHGKKSLLPFQRGKLMIFQYHYLFRKG